MWNALERFAKVLNGCQCLVELLEWGGLCVVDDTMAKGFGVSAESLLNQRGDEVGELLGVSLNTGEVFHRGA